MITGLKIASVEAKRESESEVKGLDINISIDGVRLEGQKVEVDFTYTATYRDGVGYLKMTGNVATQESSKMLGDIDRMWVRESEKDKKKLPNEYAELILNAVNFACGTNGVLVVRPVNLAPPIMPSPIQIQGDGAAGSGMGAGTTTPGGKKVAPSGRMD